MIAQGQVGQQTLNKGIVAPALRQARDGSLVVQEIGGKFQEWVSNGFVFTAKTTAGSPAAIPIYSTATNSPTLWNRASSGKLIVPIFIGASLAAGATIPDTGFKLAVTTQAGDFVATNQPFATFTNIVGVSNLIGSGLAPAGQFAHGTVTWTTQPTAFLETGIGQFTLGTAASAGFQNISYWPDGIIELLPGTAISLVAQVASATTWEVSFTWAELPISLIN